MMSTAITKSKAYFTANIIIKTFSELVKVSAWVMEFAKGNPASRIQVTKNSELLLHRMITSYCYGNALVMIYI